MIEYESPKLYSQKLTVTDNKETELKQSGYSVVETNINKPWGAYIRLDNGDAEQFIKEYFPGLTLNEAQLGSDEVELSPKILIVSPGQRLSWQKHDRRAERWTFLTSGGYHKSDTDEQGDLQLAQLGDVIQFNQGERHRLTSPGDEFTVVAEIWQHTDPSNSSDEDDIVRTQDDYSR